MIEDNDKSYLSFYYLITYVIRFFLFVILVVVAILNRDSSSCF